MTDKIIAYKGFNSDLTCRGHQYTQGETYDLGKAPVLCGAGFHATLQPIDVLRYYPPNTSVYHLVELGEVVGPREDDDSKVAGRTIKVGAKLDLTGLIKAQVEFVFKNATKPGKNGVSDEQNGLARVRKENGAATASGYFGAATASGDFGAATASGDFGAATASGYSGAATASGRSGAATASGYSGAATASGYFGAATASGDSGAATASGDSGAATASGENAVALASGFAGRARGVLGTALFLTERADDWTILAAEAVIVDGEKIKADTWYSLRGGEVVEV